MFFGTIPEQRITLYRQKDSSDPKSKFFFKKLELDEKDLFYLIRFILAFILFLYRDYSSLISPQKNSIFQLSHMHFRFLCALLTHLAFSQFFLPLC